MQWYYAEGDRQCGPVSEKELQDLATAGKLPGETLIWREGMDDWRSYSSVMSPPAAPPLAMAAPPIIANGTLCSECGRHFPTTEMVRIQNSWICANCKPIFLQRLKEGAAAPGWQSLWRANKAVVTTRTGSVFPDRCIKCNAPVTAKMKRTLYWYPPWVFLIGGVIAAMIFRKTAQVDIGVCQIHRSKRIRNMLIGAGLAVGGFIIMIVGASNEWGFVALLGIAAIIAGVVFMVLARLLSVQKMDDRHVWIKGVCAPYLNELPEWRG